MIKAKIQLGSMHLTFESENMKDIFKWSALYNNLPKVCDACQSEEVFLNHRGDKDGHDYYNIRCGTCGAEGKFGQNKVGGGLFYKWDTKMELYVAGPKKEAPATTSKDTDSLPF